MEQLLVRLGANHTDPISWLVYSRTEDEIIASGELPNAEALSSLTERAGQRSVIALAPSSEILLKWVELPPKAGRKIISAIPFMLEDELATDISQQFFAIGPKRGDEQAVAVVSHEKMELWQSWLSEAGLFCDTIIPDVLAVPVTENGWSVLTLGEQLLVRQDTFKGVQGEATWLLPTLVHFTAQQESPITITNYAGIDLSTLPNIEEAQAPLELPMQVLAKEAMQSSFNLCQGDYKVKRKRSGVLNQWRVAAVLAVLALCTSLIDKGFSLYQLKAQNQALSSEINTAVKAGFPNIGTYRNVRLKLQSELAKLEQGGGSASMLIMLDQLAPAFSATDVKPQTLRFDATRTEIRIQAQGKNFEALEQFKRTAESAGFVVEQGAINNRDNGVVGTVSVRSTS
ncbi:MAG: type II secretion system protein GspL [Alteromonas macleodii]|jgi:general secretion pathway protein L|uniref:type II secretion system protein GspL n=1 Tax=Alteromonas TaxID=226 RepID=UPI000D7516C4|nr:MULTISPECIES: type II secretion system protein GspL [Alteromonas]MCG8497794.1 type II secretion system protein GspL [Enterobacterales bacterium]MCG7635780.1 type II secretion system protein GspL [Alteromonas sp. CNT1-28]MCG7812233.1 type II secretion system protein GspL [Alteromonas sp. MCA-1]MDM7961521.1 type II secretion system protein GspL [Alteromonas macleodii]MDM8169140.1 type II secretion system protein GspL [Alteromonas macleodii]|tara:strand:+ start:367 stop:1566 length:1200 start_codon:yes stop_codon:yes gene_type:complete